MKTFNEFLKLTETKAYAKASELSDDEKKKLAMYIQFAKKDGRRGQDALNSAIVKFHGECGKWISTAEAQKAVKGKNTGRSRSRTPGEQYLDAKAKGKL